MRVLQRCLIITLGIGVSFLYFATYDNLILFSVINPNYITQTSGVKKSSGPHCKLPNNDPWDNKIVRFFKVDSSSCKRKISNMTKFEDGQLKDISNASTSCEYRCLYFKGERGYRTDKWVKMKKNELYDLFCDFIDVKCICNKTICHRYLYTQTQKSYTKEFQLENSKNPSVIIFVLDSISSSSGARSLLETNRILQQYFDATTFFYHNKAGANSRPNAHAMFTGNRIYGLEQYLFSNGTHFPEINDSCKRGALENETVTYDFLRNGYASLIADDWCCAFTWPNCNGYRNPPVDHWGGPIDVATQDKEFKSFFYNNECEKPHHKVMKYAANFLSTYNGIAKFAIIWLSFAHDSINSLSPNDKLFANFFRDNIAYLNGSFIFWIGDHGMRFGSIRQTDAGFIEDNNPLFKIVVPEYLRSNDQLMLNLRRNSRKHTSHYDLFATLYDLANVAPKTNFWNWDYFDFRKLLGEVRGGTRAQSLLRPILQERDCQDMYILNEYCICLQTWDAMNKDGQKSVKAANALIRYANFLIGEKNSSNLCATLVLSRILKVSFLKSHSIIKVELIVSPSEGKFEGFLHAINDSLFVPTHIDRLNAYKNQSYCVSDEEIRPLCFCIGKSVSHAANPKSTVSVIYNISKH